MRTGEELKKLASLERMSMEYLDDFIDGRILRGETSGVPLRRFTAHIAQASDLRDYIGRTESQLFDFVFARPHLWTMQTNGLIGKNPSVIRSLLLNSAVYINNDPKKRASAHSIAEMLRTKSRRSAMDVKVTLDAYPDLFKAVDESGWLFECRVSTVDDVILPECLFSSDNATRIDGILNVIGDDRYSSSRNPKSPTSYGGGDRGDHCSVVEHGGERPYLASGGAAAAAQSTTDGDRGDTARERINYAVGHVFCVSNDFALAFVRKRRIYCHISKFEEEIEQPLSEHVSVGDKLYIKGYYVIRAGRYQGKWRARRVSTKKPPPTRDHRDRRGRSRTTDRHRGGTSAKRAVSLDNRRRSNSPPIARSTNKPKRSATRPVDGAGDSSNSAAAAQGAARSVEDRVEPMVKKEEKEEIRLIDAGVQTEVTDVDLLIRLLRRFPHILDG